MAFSKGSVGTPKRRGMGDAAATLRRPSASAPVGTQTGSLVAALGGGAAQESGSGSLRSLPISEIAPHPDNPRTSMSDLEELAASIRSAGLRQPIVVVPRDAFLIANPSAPLPDQARWVVLAGHRRLAAAQQGGIEELHAWVRPDLASRRDAGETFIIENIHRQALTPLEEGVAFSMLADLGNSQRDIAQRSGVSQAHVSKRMSLLRLPEQVQDALAGAVLTVGEALALTQVAPEDQLAVFEISRQRSVPVVSAARELERQRLIEEAKEKARARAIKESIPFVEEAESGRGGVHLLYGDAQQIKAARAAGTLCATTDGQGNFAYATSGARTSLFAKVESESDQERKLAMKARTVAAGQLVSSGKPTVREVTDALVAAALSNSLNYNEALRLVHGWLNDSVGITEPDRHVWMARVARSEASVRGWVAWALTVASAELRARSRSVWDAEVAGYIALLRSRAGYEPTGWEDRVLASIPADFGDDSDGITASSATGRAGS